MRAVDVKHVSGRQDRTTQSGRHRELGDEIRGAADGLGAAQAPERSIPPYERRETNFCLVVEREPRRIPVEVLEARTLNITTVPSAP